MIISSATFAQLGGKTTVNKVIGLQGSLNVTVNTSTIQTFEEYFGIDSLYFSTSDSSFHYRYGGKDHKILKESTATQQNLMLWSEQLEQSPSWTIAEGTIIINQARDLTGGKTLEQITSTTEFTPLYSANVTVLANTTYRLKFDCKRGTMTDMKATLRDMTNSVNFVDGTSYYSQTSATVQRVTIEFTTPATCTSIRVYLLRDSGPTGTVFLGRVQLENTNLDYITTTTTNYP